MANKYAGYCNPCQKPVKAYSGQLERVGSKWVIWCLDCFDKSDNSSQEDRQCGDRAYEDRCAEQCGF